jgi:hypothetical protein
MARDHPSSRAVRGWTGAILASAAAWLAMAGIILASPLLFR